MALYNIGSNYQQTLTPRMVEVWSGDFAGTGGTTTSSVLPGVFGAGARIFNVNLVGSVSGSMTVQLCSATSGSVYGTLYTALGTAGAVSSTLLGQKLDQASFLQFTGGTVTLPAGAIVEFVRLA
jgi:hypothetical protein